MLSSFSQLIAITAFASVIFFNSQGMHSQKTQNCFCSTKKPLIEQCNSFCWKPGFYSNQQNTMFFNNFQQNQYETKLDVTDLNNSLPKKKINTKKFGISNNISKFCPNKSKYKTQILNKNFPNKSIFFIAEHTGKESLETALKFYNNKIEMNLLKFICFDRCLPMGILSKLKTKNSYCLTPINYQEKSFPCGKKFGNSPNTLVKLMIYKMHNDSLFSHDTLKVIEAYIPEEDISGEKNLKKIGFNNISSLDSPFKTKRLIICEKKLSQILKMTQ